MIEQFNGQEHLKNWCVVPEDQDYKSVGTFGLDDHRKSLLVEVNCADAHLCAEAPELRTALYAALTQLRVLETQGHVSLGNTFAKLNQPWRRHYLHLLPPASRPDPALLPDKRLFG